MKSKYLSAAVALLCAAGLAACGGKGNGSLSLGVQVYGLDRSGLVLQNNGGDDLAIAGTGNYYFATLMAPDAEFNVSIKTLPSGVTCTLDNNSAKINYYTYAQTRVTCTPVPYNLGGTVSGLTINGLVLADGSLTVAVAPGSSTWKFATPIGNGSPYGVTVLAQPSYIDDKGNKITQNCTVDHGTGTMPQANVTDIVVSCI
jgi:hypothetical protein